MAINKRLLAKKDMNFFAEFTANAAKMRRMFGYAVIIGVIVVGVLVAIVGYDLVRNFLIKAEITKLELVLNTEEYATLEDKAAELQRELETKKNLFYALSQMKKQVDTTNTAPADLPDTLAKCIPSDTYIKNYEITSNSANIMGYSFSYYSIVDMVHLLNEANVFTTVPKLDIKTVDPSSLGGTENFIPEGNINTNGNANGNANANKSQHNENLINIYYEYEINGLLLGDVYVTVTRYANGDQATSLSGVETYNYRVGTPYELSDNIATYETGNAKYKLVKVTVNNAAVDQKNVDGIIANNRITGNALDNVDIALYYDKVVEEAATTEGGEGK